MSNKSGPKKIQKSVILKKKKKIEFELLAVPNCKKNGINQFIMKFCYSKVVSKFSSDQNLKS